MASAGAEESEVYLNWAFHKDMFGGYWTLALNRQHAKIYLECLNAAESGKIARGVPYLTNAAIYEIAYRKDDSWAKGARARLNEVTEKEGGRTSVTGIKHPFFTKDPETGLRAFIATLPPDVDPESVIEFFNNDRSLVGMGKDYNRPDPEHQSGSLWPVADKQEDTIRPVQYRMGRIQVRGSMQNAMRRDLISATAGVCEKTGKFCVGYSGYQNAHLISVVAKSLYGIKDGLWLSATSHRQFDDGLWTVDKDGLSIMLS